MAEMKFNFKGPVGIVIGIVVVGVIAYVQFFMPLSVSSKDKKAILKKLELIRLTRMSKTSTATMKQYKNTGKFKNDLSQLEELSGNIKIVEVKGTKSLFSGNKIRVVYTIGGKTSKIDGGVLYFRIYHRKKRKSSHRKRVELTQITKASYESSQSSSEQQKEKKEEKNW